MKASSLLHALQDFSWKTVLTGLFSRGRRTQGLFHLLFCRFNIQLLQNRLAFYDVHQGFFRHHLSGIQLKIIVYKALFLLRSVLDNYLACSRFEGGCFLLRRTKCLLDSLYIALVLPVSTADWMLAQSWGQASIHLHNVWCIFCKLLRAACRASRFCSLEQAFYAANEVSCAFPAPDFLSFFPTRLLRTGIFWPFIWLV